MGEAELSMYLRNGGLQEHVLAAQSNLAGTYSSLGRYEQAMLLRRDVYSGSLKHLGAEHANTLISANNYASSLGMLRRFEEAKALMRKTIPVARRILGQNHET